MKQTDIDLKALWYKLLHRDLSQVQISHLEIQFNGFYLNIHDGLRNSYIKLRYGATVISSQEISESEYQDMVACSNEMVSESKLLAHVNKILNA